MNCRDLFVCVHCNEPSDLGKILCGGGGTRTAPPPTPSSLKQLPRSSCKTAVAACSCARGEERGAKSPLADLAKSLAAAYAANRTPATRGSCAGTLVGGGVEHRLHFPGFSLFYAKNKSFLYTFSYHFSKKLIRRLGTTKNRFIFCANFVENNLISVICNMMREGCCPPN